MAQTIYIQDIPFIIEIEQPRTAFFRGGQFSGICYLKIEDDGITNEVFYSAPYLKNENFDRIKEQLFDKIIQILPSQISFLFLTTNRYILLEASPSINGLAPNEIASLQVATA